MDHLPTRRPVRQQPHQAAIGQRLLHHHGGQFDHPHTRYRRPAQGLHVGGGEPGAVVLLHVGTIRSLQDPVMSLEGGAVSEAGP
ncbi:hypothetical protein D3C79_526940 [compost metagenome]